MDDYTFDNVLIDPNKEGIDGLIGKEVYFHDNPSFCVVNANRKSNDNLGILVEICEVSTNPFLIKLNDGTVHAYPCIIEKKKGETETKHVPFESKEEFVERYTEVKEEAELGSFNNKLFQCGMWLREKGHNSETYCMVTEIRESGVVVGNNAIATGENTVIKDFTLWENLYLGYTFPDGSPCGKEEA